MKIAVYFLVLLIVWFFYASRCYNFLGKPFLSKILKSWPISFASELILFCFCMKFFSFVSLNKRHPSCLIYNITLLKLCNSWNNLSNCKKCFLRDAQNLKPTLQIVLPHLTLLFCHYFNCFMNIRNLSKLREVARKPERSKKKFHVLNH